jgi:beta-glucosidase
VPDRHHARTAPRFDDAAGGNGVVEDPERVAYSSGHLDAVARAIADGVDVRAVLRVVAAGQLRVESRLREALRHRARRLRTQRRTLKRSGAWYREPDPRTTRDAVAPTETFAASR